MDNNETGRYGVYCESLFTAECLRRAFEPHQPATPAPHDCIVDCPAGLLKVQVKGTKTRDTNKRSETYKVRATHSKGRVLDSDIDVVAVFLEAVDSWYIVPRSAVDVSCLRFYPNPDNKISKWEVYRNNWSPFYITKENDDR